MQLITIFTLNIQKHFEILKLLIIRFSSTPSSCSIHFSSIFSYNEFSFIYYFMCSTLSGYSGLLTSNKNPFQQLSLLVQILILSMTFAPIVLLKHFTSNTSLLLFAQVSTSQDSELYNTNGAIIFSRTQF